MYFKTLEKIDIPFIRVQEERELKFGLGIRCTESKESSTSS